MLQNIRHYYFSYQYYFKYAVQPMKWNKPNKEFIWIQPPLRRKLLYVYYTTPSLDYLPSNLTHSLLIRCTLKSCSAPPNRFQKTLQYLLPAGYFDCCFWPWYKLCKWQKHNQNVSSVKAVKGSKGMVTLSFEKIGLNFINYIVHKNSIKSLKLC